MAATACGASGGKGTKVLMPTYLLGTLGTRAVDLTEVCGGNPAGAVAVYPTPTTVALGVLTLGMYTPLEIRVQCSEPAGEPRKRSRPWWR